MNEHVTRRTKSITVDVDMEERDSYSLQWIILTSQGILKIDILIILELIKLTSTFMRT